MSHLNPFSSTEEQLLAIEEAKETKKKDFEALIHRKILHKLVKKARKWSDLIKYFQTEPDVGKKVTALNFFLSCVKSKRMQMDDMNGKKKSEKQKEKESALALKRLLEYERDNPDDDDDDALIEYGCIDTEFDPG